MKYDAEKRWRCPACQTENFMRDMPLRYHSQFLGLNTYNEGLVSKCPRCQYDVGFELTQPTRLLKPGEVKDVT